MDIKGQLNNSKDSLFKAKNKNAKVKTKEEKEEEKNLSSESENQQQDVEVNTRENENKTSEESTQIYSQENEENAKKEEKEQIVQDEEKLKNSKPVSPPNSNNDAHLNQAKAVTEETVDHIQKRMNQQEEVKPQSRRDFAGLFLMLALIFSFGAMVFSIVNMLEPSGLSTAYYQSGVKFLNENSNDRFKALKQEMLDNIKALNSEMQKSMNEIKSALVQVSDNTKKLNQNMSQVQSNISNEISNQSTPDLSQLTSSISDLKASIDQVKSQTRLINGNNAFKSSNETTSSPSISHENIQYVGNSPNGAILKVIGKDKKARYITVNAGQMTAYGKVSFLDDQSIVIDGERIEKVQKEQNK